MGSKYLLSGIQGSSKTNTPRTNIGARLPSIFRSMTKQNSIRSKALMPLTISNCVLSYMQQNYLSENGLILRRNYFHNRIAR